LFDAVLPSPQRYGTSLSRTPTHAFARVSRCSDDAQVR